jgi:hypothetical protein
MRYLRCRLALTIELSLSLSRYICLHAHCHSNSGRCLCTLTQSILSLSRSEIIEAFFLFFWSRARHFGRTIEVGSTARITINLCAPHFDRVPRVSALHFFYCRPGSFAHTPPRSITSAPTTLSVAEQDWSFLVAGALLRSPYARGTWQCPAPRSQVLRALHQCAPPIAARASHRSRCRSS